MKKIRFNENTEFGGDVWKERMARNGVALKKNNVRQVIFVHGTFAGDDAFGLFSFFEPLRLAFPQAKPIVDDISY